MKGEWGYEGPRGPIGVPGVPGVIGPRGHPGDAKLSEEEFSRVSSNVSLEVLGQVMKRVAELEGSQSLMQCTNQPKQPVWHLQPQLETCGPKWRRVAPNGDVWPTLTPLKALDSASGLVEHVNTTNQRACGRSTDSGCSSVTYPAGGRYQEWYRPRNQDAQGLLLQKRCLL